MCGRGLLAGLIPYAECYYINLSSTKENTFSITHLGKEVGKATIREIMKRAISSSMHKVR
jgi:hypothetical protein